VQYECAICGHPVSSDSDTFWSVTTSDGQNDVRAIDVCEACYEMARIVESIQQEQRRGNPFYVR